MNTTIKYDSYIFNIAPLMAISKTAKRDGALKNSYDIVTLRLSTSLLPSGDYSAWSLNDMYSQISGLSSAFSQDNKLLIISGEFGEIIRLDPSGTPPRSVRVVSLDIPTSKIIDKTPFELTLEYFDNNYDNVIEKIDEWTFGSVEDGTYAVSHRINAVGLNTLASGTNAISHARAWVLANSGANNVIASGVIIPTGYGTYNLQTEENINEINGVYNILQRWSRAVDAYFYDEVIKNTTDVDPDSNSTAGIERQMVIRGLGATPAIRKANAATCPLPIWFDETPGPGGSKLSDTGGEVITYSLRTVTYTAGTPPYAQTTTIANSIDIDDNGCIIDTATTTITREGYGLTRAQRILNAQGVPTPSAPGSPGDSSSLNTGGPVCTSVSTRTTFTAPSPPAIIENIEQKTLEVDEWGYITQVDSKQRVVRGLGRTIQERVAAANAQPGGGWEASNPGESASSNTGGEVCTYSWSLRHSGPGGEKGAISTSISTNTDIMTGLITSIVSTTHQGFGATPAERVSNCPGGTGPGSPGGGASTQVGYSEVINNIAGSKTYTYTYTNEVAPPGGMARSSRGVTIDGGEDMYAVIPTLDGIVRQDLGFKNLIRTTRFASAVAKIGQSAGEALGLCKAHCGEGPDGYTETVDEDARSASVSAITITGGVSE